jgi:hypothetical protein
MSTTPVSLEVAREARERREARDRILAREVGIEIGRRRERERIMRQQDKAKSRWFVIGIFVGAIAMLAWFAPMARAAAPANQQTLGAKHEPAMPHPDIIRAIIRIGQCEQPAPSGLNYYAGIRWDAYPGKTWPGGLGIMQIHHLQFRAPGTPADPTKATPAQQIRVAWRAYKHYRRIYGVGGGATFWVCSSKIGFGGVLHDNRTVVWR